VNLVKISVCGLVCERCPKFLKGHCSGCGPNDFCPFPACAEEKGVEICFDCRDFPCEKHYKHKLFSEEWLDFIKSDEVVG